MTGTHPPAREDYLKGGLIAMARAGHAEWFSGHIGAGLIALGEVLGGLELRPRVRKQVEEAGITWRSQHLEFFRGTERVAWRPLDESVLASFESQISEHCHHLSRSGHGVIFGTIILIAMRELGVMPDALALQSLGELLDSCRHDVPNRYLGIQNYDDYTVPENFPIAAYTDEQDLIRAAGRVLEYPAPDQEIEGDLYFFHGERGHVLTHAHALILLRQMGYQDLARSGYAEHRRQLALTLHQAEQSPRFTERPFQKPPSEAAYWKGRTEVDDAHAFKYLWSVFALREFLNPIERAKWDDHLTLFWA